MKTCTKCSVAKSADEFGHSSRNKDGLYSSCKQCQREFRQANKEKISKKARKHREKNSEAITRKKRQYYLENKEAVKRARREYHQTNKTTISEKRKTEHRNNPTKTLLGSASRRARKRGLEFNLKADDVIIPEKCPRLPDITLAIADNESAAKQGHSPTLDRIDSTKGYTRENVEVISYRANSIKSNSTLEERLLLVIHDLRSRCALPAKVALFALEEFEKELSISLTG